jgi:hypothetical protein
VFHRGRALKADSKIPVYIPRIIAYISITHARVLSRHAAQLHIAHPDAWEHVVGVYQLVARGNTEGENTE